MVSANRFPSSLGLSMLSEMEREMHALSGRDDVKSRKKCKTRKIINAPCTHKNVNRGHTSNAPDGVSTLLKEQATKHRGRRKRSKKPSDSSALKFRKNHA